MADWVYTVADFIITDPGIICLVLFFAACVLAWAYFAPQTSEEELEE